jgi:hypothetical protein
MVFSAAISCGGSDSNYVGPPPPDCKMPGYLFAFIVDHNSGMVTDIHLEPKL